MNKQKTADASSQKKIVMIIIVVLLILGLLGVGGYLMSKSFINYFFNKNNNVLKNQNNQLELEENSSKAKLIELLKYPNVTSFQANYADYSKDLIITESTTLDSVDTIFDYYKRLGSLNNWEEGSQGIPTDNSGAWMYFNENDDDFNISIQIVDQGDHRSITIQIHSESDDFDFSNKKPEVNNTANNQVSANNNQEPKKINQGEDYVFADSNRRILSKAELVDLTPWQLKVARNEIYARHGRAFAHQDLQCYFRNKEWYVVNPNYSNSLLSTIENQNIATILKYEETIESPYLKKDSGCHN